MFKATLQSHAISEIPAYELKPGAKLGPWIIGSLIS